MDVFNRTILHLSCVFVVLSLPAAIEAAHQPDFWRDNDAVRQPVESGSHAALVYPLPVIWPSGGAFSPDVPTDPIELLAWYDENIIAMVPASDGDVTMSEALPALSQPEPLAIEQQPQSMEPWIDESMAGTAVSSEMWTWRVLPSGLIYRSYMAGVHEPRIAIVAFYEQEAGQSLWDATLGGRGGVLRYGDGDPLRPQGWQLDVEGAVMVRLDVENRQDLESSDYRFGFPITYGIANWQFKFGYYHISSHLGDERMLREPGQDERINYVRDGILYGVSYYPVPSIRIYGELGGAFNADGGAKPFETQFGTELAPPGPTGGRGAPFLAINGHLRQDHHFGGDVSLQTGWLWRGEFGQKMRLGMHYFNGKSSQFQFFNAYEQQIGGGLWYDF